MENYKKTLSSLGLLAILEKSSSEEMSFNDVVKSVFRITKDSKKEDIYAKLSDGTLILKREGALQDKIFLQNCSNTSKFIRQNKINSPQNILAVRKILLNGLKDRHVEGFRRYRVRTQNYVTANFVNVEASLSKLLKELEGERSGIFLNAIDFFLNFGKLHPFEDENGRVERVILNAYLRSKFLSPIFWNHDRRETYNYTIDYFNFCNYKGGFVAFATVSAFEGIGITKLSKVFSNNRVDNEYELEIKSLIKAIGIDKRHSTLNKDILKLYQEGVNKDSNLICAALCISTLRKIDSPIILESLKNINPKIKSAAMLAGNQASHQKYINEIKEFAYSDKSDLVRILAIGLIERNELLDEKIINKILMTKPSVTVKLTLSRAITNMEQNDSLVKVARDLIKSKNKDLRLRGYQCLVAHGTTNEILKIEEKVYGEPPEIIRAMLMELHKSKKSQNGPLLDMSLRLNEVSTEIIFNSKNSMKENPAVDNQITFDNKISKLVRKEGLKIINLRTT